MGISRLRRFSFKSNGEKRRRLVEASRRVMENPFVSDEFPMRFSVGETFQFYYIPFLVCLGTIGNSLSVYVFFNSPKLRHLSSSFYLSALAISDTIFLLCIFLVWFRFYEIDMFNHQGACQILVYVASVCSFSSVWLVVSFTVERFIAVQYPLIQRSICTVSRAKLVIFSVTVIASIINLPLTYVSGVVHYGDYDACAVRPDCAHVASVFNYVDTLLTYVVPVTVIVFLNVWIGRAVFRFREIRRRMTTRRDVSGGVAGTSDSLRLKCGAATSQKNVTKMLLTVSSVFVLFNLPSYVLRIMVYLIELEALDVNSHYRLLQFQQWCQLLFYTNFGINFILYCVSGRNFRKSLKNLAKNSRPRRGRTEIIVLTDSRAQSSGSSLASFRRKLNLL